MPYLYTDQDIENIFKIADSFTASHAVKNKNIAYEICSRHLSLLL